jgi:AcrR family transcriptional regulator
MKAAPRKSAVSRPATRNPERTQQRIFEAAFKEFAAKGFAGARVDVIARRAGINKRMLYHYFGDKEGLFREVLRRKMAQRQTWSEAMPDDPRESLPYRFELAFKDPQWIRLLEWEALQFADKRLIDETKRQRSVDAAVKWIASRQERGHLSSHFEPRELLLGMVALTWFPLAFPQLTRLITRQSVFDARFRARQRKFLRQMASVFAEPKAGTAWASVNNGGGQRNGSSPTVRRKIAPSTRGGAKSSSGNGVWNSKHS